MWRQVDKVVLVLLYAVACWVVFKILIEFFEFIRVTMH